jgi:D-alanyl-D-alanine dipeptidase
VDLTLSKDGKEVDMGTPYDHLGTLSEPRHEERFLAEGKLTAAHVQSRRILRDAMTKGGAFRMIRNEWWHFDAYQGEALRSRYAPLDIPLDQLPSTP